MPNGIINNGNKIFEREMKLSEWRGYMKKAVEDINDDVKDLKHDFNKDIKELKDALEEIRRAQVAQQMKVAGISSGLALVITIVTILISNAIV